MWEVIITVAIIAFIFILNPIKWIQDNSPAKTDTQTEVNQVLNQTEQQINQAKMLQNQEREELNSN